MPRKRIPTRYTNRFKARAVEDWREAKTRGVSRVEFAKSRGVVEPSVLILDSLSVHMMAEIADALACTGTSVLYVPGGCTGVAQPLDVGVMSPVKQHIRCLNSSRSVGRPKQVTPAYRRREIFERAMEGLRFISADTVKNSFHKAGPFMPYGPPNNAAGSPIAWSRDSVVDYTEIVEEVTV
ncbi:unnamed protein product [Phytophthora fragariaefolia]|uniref:Unnamed protein product n=1 Tax=Phytophthora fragariaefolia TaxID=1490495 RepID=A0A9W7CSV6_9STRA|nr:unnamed protein product [Phytophthora fragariaefolia]